MPKEEAQKTTKSPLDDLMDSQARTKPKILKKWIGMGRKKCDYNCHTNFTSLKLAKSVASNGRLKGDTVPFDQLVNGHETCQSSAMPNEANNKTNFAKENEPIKEKSGRLLGKAGKDTTSLFNMIFRSLTSSSSNSNPASNPSDNMSQQNSASNEPLNAALNNRTADKEPEERNLTNNKSFDLNDEAKLNLSLNSLQGSPQRLAISVQNLPES